MRWRFGKRILLVCIALVAVAAGLYVVAGVNRIDSDLLYLEEHPNLTFPELSEYFSDIAKQKGAAYAFDVLRRAPLPANTDTHLLGHVVGDELYLQQGAKGIEVCTQDFRNACSHTIATGVLSEKGEAGLSEIAALCREAPGGLGAYTMCFHGLGHGVFAYTGYDLPATISLCEKTGTEAYFNREYLECFGGAIMELVGGGGHDLSLWKEANARYLSSSNPRSPCDTPLVPEELRPICYTYLTPHLFTQGGGALGALGPREFTRAFSLCEEIPNEREDERRACFAGVGKELPTLAAARDIRSIDTLSSLALARVSSWCKLAESADGREYCVRSVVQSLFWGGENDPRAAVSFCRVTSGETQESCFGELFNAAEYYYRDNSSAKVALCVQVPPERYNMCETSLSL